MPLGREGSTRSGILPPARRDHTGSIALLERRFQGRYPEVRLRYPGQEPPLAGSETSTTRLPRGSGRSLAQGGAGVYQKPSYFGHSSNRGGIGPKGKFSSLAFGSPVTTACFSYRDPNSAECHVRPKAAVRPRPRLSGPIALVQAMPAWESDAVESQAALTRR